MSSRSWDRGSDALAAAITLAVAVTLFAWGGNWLDGRLGTRPLFLIVGVALGLVGGFIHLLHRLAPDMLPFGRQQEDSDAEDDRPPDDH